MNFLRSLIPHSSSMTASVEGARSMVTSTPSGGPVEIATVAAGCFWGVEKIYRRYFEGKGLLDARVGYTGGDTSNPSYRQVCTTSTGHAEALQVVFDPSVVTYETLIDFFFHIHDPTTLNQQGMDTGTQYRSAIFTNSEAQAQTAHRVKDARQNDLWKGKPITTQIVEAGKWWDAEDYHQKYLDKNPHGYECPTHYYRQ